MSKTKKKPADPPDQEVFQLRVALGEPPYCVWRRVQLSTRTRLSALHEVLQIVMGWAGSHLHEFEIDGKLYGVPSPDDDVKVYDEAKPSLASQLEVGDVFVYRYDLGDGWEHEIRVEAKLACVAGQAYPICIGGRLAGPPEDCGGYYQYVDIVEALLDADAPADPALLDAYAEYDPDAFSVDAVNQCLHGKQVTAPRDPTLEPRLDALAAALVQAVDAWWRAPNQIDRDVLAEWRTLALSLCAAVAEHEGGAAQLAALDERCAGRLEPWLHQLPIELARAGERDDGLALLAATPSLPPKQADGIRVNVHVAAGRPDDARAAIDALFATHGRDPETLMCAAFALEELADWPRVEAVTRELAARDDADIDDRAIASGLLVAALRALGRGDEADEVEATGGPWEDAFDDDEDAELDDDDGFDELDDDAPRPPTRR